LIALANTVYWNRVYDSNLEHMLGVRIVAADYIREQIPEGETCAAFDVGALRYYSGRPLVDLGALIDPSLFDWFLSGKSDQYLIQNGVTCLAIPGQLGDTSGGVVDIAKISGLSQSSLYDLQQDKVFQIDRDRWLIGYQPTMNYQAAVTIYRLVNKKAADLDFRPLSSGNR
jgi:hypothetical protein